MYTLIITTIIYVHAGQAEGQKFDAIQSMSTSQVTGFEDKAACEAAAKTIGGTGLNAERQTVCVAL
ncbi:hypothetical protein [Aurantimonas sp. VKM B-3413]|uniref:hypothetical protein n=1 Tax=Aurantimonas sp. VKM B-3413 TaxID=2779401 RepID=UPI001E4953B5|nr:hypothetical protein [Aurantimonas sp. VKM B-3413]MCB8840544.1 hypothetical protein [Aurantimonas sp. VKM B-3413]